MMTVAGCSDLPQLIPSNHEDQDYQYVINERSKEDQNKRPPPYSIHSHRYNGVR